MCCEIQPKQLVTYNRIYHTEVQQNKINIIAHLKEREYAILDEIKSVYSGAACNGQDLDVFIKNHKPPIREAFYYLSKCSNSTSILSGEYSVSAEYARQISAISSIVRLRFCV